MNRFYRWTSLSIALYLFSISQTFAQTDRSSMLITAKTLDKQLSGDSRVIVLDARSQSAYASGHIPSARWIDVNEWKTESLKPSGLEDVGYWSGELGALGISQDDSLVIAGDSLPETARAWWLLRYLGMPNVQLLDGGYAAWSAGQGELSTATPAIEASQTKIELQSDRLAVLSDVLADVSRQTTCQVLDNRSPAEFSGERSGGSRSGHIPGAVNLEWSQLVDKQGMFLPGQQILKLLSATGASGDEVFIAHCQTGGRSSVAVFALELAGVKVRNYYSGWSQYAETPAAPVEK